MPDIFDLEDGKSSVTRLSLADQRMGFDDQFEEDEEVVEPILPVFLQLKEPSVKRKAEESTTCNLRAATSQANSTRDGKEQTGEKQQSKWKATEKIYAQNSVDRRMSQRDRVQKQQFEGNGIRRRNRRDEPPPNDKMANYHRAQCHTRRPQKRQRNTGDRPPPPPPQYLVGGPFQGLGRRRLELDEFARVQASRQQELERRLVDLECRERALQEEKRDLLEIRNCPQQEEKVNSANRPNRKEHLDLLRERAELQKAIADHELRVEREQRELEDKRKAMQLENTMEMAALQKASMDKELQREKEQTELEEKLHVRTRELVEEKEKLRKLAQENETSLENERMAMQREVANKEAKLDEARRSLEQERRSFRCEQETTLARLQAERSKFFSLQSQFEAEKLEHLRSVNQKMTELARRDDELVRTRHSLAQAERVHGENVSLFERKRDEIDHDLNKRDEYLILASAYMETELEEIARNRQDTKQKAENLAAQKSALEKARQTAEEKYSKQRKDLEKWIMDAESKLRQQEEDLSKREKLISIKEAELASRETSQKRRVFEPNQSFKSRKASFDAKAPTSANTSFSVPDDSKTTSTQTKAKVQNEEGKGVSGQGFVLVDSDDEEATQKCASRAPKVPGFDYHKNFNSYMDNEEAEKIQERLFKEAAEKFRNRTKVNVVAGSAAAPPIFASVVYDISSRHPDHWKWKDPYSRLGLPPKSSIRLVKKQYRSLARIYHPDKSLQSDSTDRFNAISAAYHHLIDSA